MLRQMIALIRSRGKDQKLRIINSHVILILQWLNDIKSFINFVFIYQNKQKLQIKNNVCDIFTLLEMSEKTT